MNAEHKKHSERVGEPQATDSSEILPEFGRHLDVRRLFGIKRGILYRLIAERKIKSITLREPGRSFGCRLIYLPSVRAYLNSLLAEQNPLQAKPISPEQEVQASEIKQTRTN